MELLNQFQGFLGSLGIGFFFYMIFHPIYRIFQKASFFIKFPAFLIVFIGGTIFYFMFLIKYNYGIMNIFYPLSILIGVCFYHIFYFMPFDDFYLRTMAKVRDLIKLKRKKLFAIINKKVKEKKHVKTIESKK